MSLRPTGAMVFPARWGPRIRIATAAVLVAAATTAQAGVTVSLNTAPGLPAAGSSGSAVTGYTAGFYTDATINALNGPAFPTGLGTAPAPTSGGIPGAATTFSTVVIGPNGTFPVGTNWLPNDPTSSWIGPGVNGQSAGSGLPNPINGFSSSNSSPQGYYYYDKEFTLDTTIGATLNGGLWTTDNNGIAIYLNGVFQGNVTPAEGFAGFTSFAVNAANFLTGTNHLTFVVFNETFTTLGGVHASPTGINVRGTVTTVPEPSTMIGGGLGALLAGLGAYRRRRRAG